jgi:ATP-dependent exoDNAse (exonuclease V) alpha subunit
LLGPAGSGKSTATEVAINEVVRKGGNVLIACPTGMLAASYRQKFPNLDADTIHGAFSIFEPEHQTLDRMTEFDFIIIEEVGQLSSYIFDRLMRLWNAAGKRPALIFVGDFCQLRGVEPTRAHDSYLWHNVRQHHLNTMRRCNCEELKWKLDLLRSHKPSQQQLKKILRGHKAPSRANRSAYVQSGAPSCEDIGAIFVETPHTAFVTYTKASTARINAWALQHFFGDKRPLTWVATGPEANPDNYDELVQVRHEPLQMPIHIGLRVTLIKNLNKPNDYVNGMGAVVLDLLDGGILVLTHTKKRVVVYPWTDPTTKYTYYPMRLGYSTTLHKVQGATLDHMTIWLDVANIEGAAYVALSRVRHDADWRFVGNPGVHHFPAVTGF